MSPRNRRRNSGPTADVGGPLDPHTSDGVRLQKVMAQAGVGSRRACEVIIQKGRVTVDGAQVRELGTRVDPETAVIHVDGRRLILDPTKVTLALNKPRGVISALEDPQGRPTLAPWVDGRPEHLVHVGRLDVETEGLLLLSSDGELTHRLTHPSYEVPKTYLAKVQGELTGAVRKILLDGIELEDGPARADAFHIKGFHDGRTLVEITLHEGRNRIVRRMLDAVGHPVTRLTRTAIGPVRLGSLKSGQVREVESRELGDLMRAVGL